jgi:proteic killer suppression protein
MILSFADQGTEDIYHGEMTRKSRATCPQDLWDVARRKLDQIHWSRELDSLRIPPGNRLEMLQGDRAGQHSVRINQRYRICFRWVDDGAENVEIVDYH